MQQQHSAPLSPIPTSASTLLGKRIKHPRIQQVMTELDTLIYPVARTAFSFAAPPAQAKPR
jgi:hypothetical protein